MRAYDHSRIEKKWQQFWNKNKIYTTRDNAPGKENFYLLVEFPYPSGNLHVGHWYAFAVPDILARYLRMRGKNVLFPIGFDAFGLPAENAAIKHGIDPKKWTLSNIAHMKKQIASMGTSFDWSRLVSTCDPAYYKWTQWLFLQLFKKGLAYQKETAVNWCPVDKTVLANEQVVDGKCDRCGSEVVQKEMLQWNIKITDYAERLVNDLKDLDWPLEIKDSQRNWIGRSEGTEIDFPLDIGITYKYVFLHGFEGSPDLPRYQFWKTELERLGHRVIIPQLPNTKHPSEEEQVEAALKATEYDEHTVLFGHSLGTVVALKVLERLDKPIGRLVLAGAFVDPNFADKRREFKKTFSWQFDAQKIKANAPVIQLLHDDSDYAVSNDQVAAVEKLLNIKAIHMKGEAPHFTGKFERSVLMWLRATIRVFTTRPDTLFGATYIVLAPEYPLLRQGFGGQAWVDRLKNAEEVRTYISEAAKKTELERQTNQKEKTGVELKGVKAVNPATNAEVPVYVADYVLGSYGTGAIMAVPAHDERDYAFATKFGLPIIDVVEPVQQASGEDAVDPTLPMKERNAVEVILKHWAEDKYMCLKLKSRNVRTFVTGAIEPGEGAIAAAQREIWEETGYKNARFVRNLGGRIHAKFSHPLKPENVFAHFQPMYFELTDGAQDVVSEEEIAKHEPHWVDADDVTRFINRGDIEQAWARYRGNTLYTGEGLLTNSLRFSGMTTEEAKNAITEAFGTKKTTYKLRDWIVSRQRYWGVPIPVIHCPSCGIVPVPDKDLPIKLPPVKDYLPDGSGRSPLAKATKWVNVKCPKCKREAMRETDTFDTFVDSSWYFQRYTDPKNAKKFADPKKLESWMPVDLYSGGAEHTTMHVFYSRFWQKAMYDIGLVKDSEPYTRRMNRSLIMGPDGQKMSKSRGNVVDPDEVVRQLGADTVRMYLAFIGPYNEVSNYPWNPDGVVGVRRFLERIWDYVEGPLEWKHVVSLNPKDKFWKMENSTPDIDVALNKMIKQVSEDISRLKFNTAISAMMIFLNLMKSESKLEDVHQGAKFYSAHGHTLTKPQLKKFLRVLAPFAPHISEELWHSIGEKRSIHLEKWPQHDEKLLKKEAVTIVIQIDGKTRGQVEISADADKEAMETAARKVVQERLEGKEVARVIAVPGRLVNFVLKK